MTDKTKKRREYMRAYMQKLRENPSFREKERIKDRNAKRKLKRVKKRKQVETSLERYDLNVGMKPLKEKFMTYHEYKLIFSDATFKQYLKDKNEFVKEQEVKPLNPPLNLQPEEQAFAEGIKVARYRKSDLIGFKSSSKKKDSDSS